MFPCEHGFHADCLLAYVLKENNSSAFQQRVLQLQQKIAAEQVMDANKKLNSPLRRFEELNNIQSRDFQSPEKQLDELVGSECAFCGDLMWKSVDRPLIDNQDSGLLQAWSLA